MVYGSVSYDITWVHRQGTGMWRPAKGGEAESLLRSRLGLLNAGEICPGPSRNGLLLKVRLMLHMVQRLLVPGLIFGETVKGGSKCVETGLKMVGLSTRQGGDNFQLSSSPRPCGEIQMPPMMFKILQNCPQFLPSLITHYSLLISVLAIGALNQRHVSSFPMHLFTAFLLPALPFYSLI